MTTTPDTANEKDALTMAQRLVAELAGAPRERQLLAVEFATKQLGLEYAPLAPKASGSPLMAGAVEPVVARVGHPTDIKAFTSEKSPKSDQQFAAVVAYYYQFEAPTAERRETINATIMRDAARLSGRPQVKEWLTTLNNANRSGYLDRAEPGSFKLNAVGENLVAITLPGNGKAEKRATARKTAKKGVGTKAA